VIPHNRPCVTAEDRAAVDAVLTSGWIAQGSVVTALETEFTKYYTGGGACAVSSGTAALFLALRTLGAGPGVTVGLPSYSCSALLNSVYMTGAIPKIFDVRADTFCLDVEGVLAQAPEVRIVVAVHTFGAAADAVALKSAGMTVVEDCCQSLGGIIEGRALGAVGDAAVFSFYASKIVTGGQGGLLWSRADSVVTQALDYRQFDGRESYNPRFNFQMTDTQAALVVSQLTRLDAIRARRARLAHLYRSALPNVLGTQAGLDQPGSMVHRFVIVTGDISVRNALLQWMADAGVQCAIPVERFELLHRYMKLDPNDFPVSEQLVDTTLSIPIHMCLSDSDVETICNALGKFKL